MRKEMIRINQKLTDKECQEVLEQFGDGVLSLIGDDDYLYSMPLDFALFGGNIYFHGSPKGYRRECVERTEKTSFCIVAQSEVVPNLRANNFRSVIVWGKLRVVTDKEEKINRAHASLI